MDLRLFNGNCLDVLKRLPSDSIDSIVTDPPYGLKFMGKIWDYDVPSVEIWKECLRVLKPGGHLLAFGGTRTYHRLVVNIEDAGFEIRDQIQWIYGQGFPKSQDISKAIDKAAGAEREVVSSYKQPDIRNNRKADKSEDRIGSNRIDGEVQYQTINVTVPTTPDAQKWSGWGTALKPANEPICLARKPLSETTIAKNVLKWNTGGLNIDASRIINANPSTTRISEETTGTKHGGDAVFKLPETSANLENSAQNSENFYVQPGMSFPIQNWTRESEMEKRMPEEGWLSCDSSERQRDAGTSTCDGKTFEKEASGYRGGSSFERDPRRQSDRESQDLQSTRQAHSRESHQAIEEDRPISQALGRFPSNVILDEESAKLLDEQTGILKSGGGDKGNRPGVKGVFGRSRADGFNAQYEADNGGASRFFYCAKASKSDRNSGLYGDLKNTHSTVKPIKLMEYLIRLITPPNGNVLDPFMGSGTTGVVAKNLGFGFYGVELSAEYFSIAKARIGSDESVHMDQSKNKKMKLKVKFNRAG